MIRSPHILFIANKRSGKGSHQRLEALAGRVCKHYGATHTVQYTEAPRHATELAREGMTKGYTCIVAVGGDGTVNEIAVALKGADIPLAIVPAGSGNGLARHLGVPMDWEKAIRAIFASSIVRIDSLTVNDRLSVNVSGIGFDAHVAGLFGLSGRRGMLQYARIAVKEYGRFSAFNASLSIDGHKPLHRGAFIIAIANSTQYGNNARIAPNSSVCDGKLNVNVITKVPLMRLDLAYSLFRGDITRSRSSEMFEARQLTLQLDRPVRYHVDGEPCSEGDRFLIRVEPSSLPVMVPRNRVGKI